MTKYVKGAGLFNRFTKVESHDMLKIKVNSLSPERKS